MSTNKVIVSGYIGQNAEIRTFEDGGKVASFSLATGETWRDKESGEWAERTEWHKIVTKQEGLVAIFEKHAVKGRLATVVGKLQYRTYRKEGEATDRTVAEIVVDIRGEVDFPTPKPE